MSFVCQLLVNLATAVMALIDSEKAFQKRCDELYEGLFEKMKIQHITTFSTFAFSIGSPQNPVSDAEFSQLTDSIFDGQSSLGTTAILRRLHFEACTLLVADMKIQSASVDASEPVRKLPYVEKVSRLEAQKKKLCGLLHSPEQQPSHCLIDSVFSMVESGSLTYVHPSKCHSREHEVQAEAKSRSKTMLTLEQGALKQTVISNLSDIDTGTELKLYFALQRRHLAFDLVGLLSWNQCQKWLDKLMSSVVSDAPQHFNPINLTQIMRADREIFSLMASEHKGSLKGASGAKPPLDDVFEKLMHDPRINVHLIAMPKPQTATPNPTPKRPLENAADVKQGSPKKPRPANRPSKTLPQLPDELQGMHRKTAAGKPMCWHYNLAKGCNNPVKQERCRFGMHHCMKCLKVGHGAAKCRSE
eukprot:s3929_g4.t1